MNYMALHPIDLAERLHRRHWIVAASGRNRSGRTVVRIEQGGFSAAMFADDAAELIDGAATLEEILERNKSADLAIGWPA